MLNPIKPLGRNMQVSNNIVGNILGHNKFGGASSAMQREWARMSPAQKNIARKKYPDCDKDGVPNKWDCQPKNKYRQEEQSYSDWEGDVGYELQDIMKITNSDAQGLMESQSFLMQQSWSKGLGATETARKIALASRVRR